YQHRDQLFPNSQEAAPAPVKPADPIARAERLHKARKTAIALSQLKRIPPSDPHYQRAQKLIAEWSGGASAAAPGAETTAVPNGATATAAAEGATTEV